LEGEEGDVERLSHSLSHSFLHAGDFLNSIKLSKVVSLTDLLL
jgi:hypothetical protein